MKLIIGAMHEELKDLIIDLQAQKVNDSLVEEYVVPDKDLVIAVSQIGLVNASMTLTYLLTKYQDQDIEFVLNIGTAATSDKTAKQGDILVIQKAIYGFADATGFGYEYGQIPQMPVFYESDLELTKMIQLKLNQQLKITNIASSDMFVNSLEISETITNQANLDITTFDMEATALFQVAYQFKVKIVCLKVVSDNLNHLNSNEKQFDVFLSLASKEISEITKVII